MKRRAHEMIVFTLIATLFLTVAFTSACNKGGSSMSPTDALKAYYDAAKKKDIDTVKKYLSRASLQMMEDFAKAQGKSLDQMFQEGANRDAQMPTPEFSNEKIDGDNATVDIKAPNQPVITMQMVKEDGMWKLAIDKMMKNAGVTPPAPK
ncbi:MAG TPA: hypothetical protein VKB86_04200 [Pyrinomonadaceae bacterium]|nr:hypothetical protein [Pyrinomonadaceae bacterium]